MNRQQFVLNELQALATDVADLTKAELEDIAARVKSVQEANRNPRAPFLATPWDPDHLKAELAYFMCRLNAVIIYLQSSDAK